MIEGHTGAVLQFSGGKDSTALLYLARPYLDKITVVFGDTGAVFPHVVEHVIGTCRKLGANLRIVHPVMPVAEYTEKYGLPTDILPVEAASDVAPLMSIQPMQPLQSYFRCCASMLWIPMGAAFREMGATLVLRGSKRADTRVGVPHGHVENGIEYRSPLWDWTDADVYAYLDREGVTLPKHYDTINDSLDCWLCTAHLAHHGAEKMRFIQEHYPDLWPEVSRRLRAVRGVIEHETARIAPALNEAAA